MSELSKEEFKALLKKAALNKKQLSELLETSYQSVNNWGTNGRDYPYWVKSWLELYIENKQCKDLKAMIKDSGVCE